MLSMNVDGRGVLSLYCLYPVLQSVYIGSCYSILTVLVATVDAQWEGMGDVGSARYELALLPPCPTVSVLSYSNQ